MNNNFSENLKKIRKEYKLSQEQLADELGVTRQAISKWESSSAYPEMDKIIALCDKFNLNIDDLLHKDIKEVKGEEETRNGLNKLIDGFLNYITDSVSLFSNMSFKSKIKCFFEETVIILILVIISLIIVNFGSSFFSHLLSILPYGVNNFISDILQFILIIFCVIFSIIILSHIFKTRYLDYYDKVKSNNNDIVDSELKSNKILFKMNEDKIIIRDPKHSEYGFIKGLFNFIIGIIKFFALCFSIFLCVILICLVFCLVITFLIYKTGFVFVGLISMVLSSCVIDVILLLMIFNFVFNRKNDKKKMIWGFIISLIVFGIGCGMVFIGSLDFKFSDNDDLFRTEVREYEFSNDLIFSIYSDVRYVSSDIDNIKLEYKINKYCSISEERYNDGNNIHIFVYCSDPMKIIREVIRNLNDKKVISINNEIRDVVIYANDENINKLKDNWNNYISNY